MFGLTGKFQSRRESDLEQESNLTTNPKNDYQKSKYGTGYRNGSKWSSDWSRSSNTSNTSPEHPITFEVTSSGRRWLICMLIAVSLLLFLLITAIIIAYAMNVLIIKFPSSTTTHQPYPFITSTLSPNFTIQPFPPLFPTPIPPYKPPIITTLPIPTDHLQKQTFLCQIFLLNQANEIYANHNRFEYQQTSQMIQNVIYNQLKQTPLRPYLENVYVWYLYNSGPDLAVEFSIILLTPSHPNIGVTSVKNVFISVLPEIEDQLNGTHIDKNKISIQYLNHH
ncbi:Uncharacterized protein BM_BM13019 [Brugia malayi]|uniref:SEA domain-containing protein n=1 Tax=Brugia malayi TaxID=6279 RepID=A0A4E9FLA9_BRUMA|nr:Uncharacterized protein BM_BM13019 [Brugia malayi]VIO97735.1 Uncharacterized protein BM_BM13019 [Brugia malayi]